MTQILVPLSPAEALERYVLLALRLEHTDDATTREHLEVQIAALKAQLAPHGYDEDEVALYEAYADLRALQADLHAHDARNDFGPGFVALARAQIAAQAHLETVCSALADERGCAR